MEADKMRIGEFCKRFRVSEDTIRYYIKMGILVPDTQNRQYRFDTSSEADMEMILRLKSEGFTLREIHRIVSLYRLSQFAAPEDKAQLEDIYLAKQTELIGRRRQVEAAVSSVRLMQAECERMGDESGMAGHEREVTGSGED